MSAIPDTLYMLESSDVNLPLPYSGSPVSTVDIIAGTIPGMEGLKLDIFLNLTSCIQMSLVGNTWIKISG